jgi:hypothetical protein
MPGYRGGRMIQEDRLFKIGFYWVLGCIIMMAVIEAIALRGVADLLRYPWILNYLYIIGFCFIGLVFYIKFERHNINPVRFLKKNTRKTFLICLMALVICIIVMGVLFTLSRHIRFYDGLDQDAFSTIERLYLGGRVLGIFMYIAIFIIGLSFYHLITTVFYNRGYPDILESKKRKMINITVIVGISACILQFLDLVLYISRINYGYDPFPIIELGSDLWIIPANIPFWISPLLMIIYLVLIFSIIIKSIPPEHKRIVLGTFIKIDISSNFRIASFLVIVFGITRAITGMIQYRFTSFTSGIFGGPIMHELIIHNIHNPLRDYSSLFVLFGFLLFCIGFFHIFRAWEIQRMMEPGKPT